MILSKKLLYGWSLKCTKIFIVSSKVRNGCSIKVTVSIGRVNISFHNLKVSKFFANQKSGEFLQKKKEFCKKIEAF